MKKLSRQTRLQRASFLKMQLMADNTSQLEWEGKALLCGPHVISVLGLFAKPTTIKEALDQIQVKKRAHWIEITSAIQFLYEWDVLFDADNVKENVDADRGWGNPDIHIGLLNDIRRTKCFQKAIAEVIRPGDIVVEIGTASGILATTAAKAGAHHVYAIEANTAIARVAQETFKNNHLSDRISLITGWSTEIDLPEKADVLITDLVGHNPFSDHVWEISVDAINRFLKPDARLLPNILRLYGLGVNVPDPELLKNVVLPSTIASWNQHYQIDLSSMKKLIPDPEAPRLWTKPQKMKEWKKFCEPVLLAEIDFKNQEQVQIDNLKEVHALQEGILNGIVGYFEIQLSPETRLSTSPQDVDNNNFWYCPVWIPSKSFALAKGDIFYIQYNVGVSSSKPRLRTWLFEKNTTSTKHK